MLRSIFRRPTAFGVAAVAAILFVARSGSGTAVSVPAPALDASLTAAKGEQVAVFSGGCFWGVQAVFQHMKGVVSAVSGYAGGQANTATYEQVSEGTTGHAESVRVTFDSSQVSYGQLLQVFFSVAHDPTELNYQGPDHGTQYRSEIWYTSPQQKTIAEAYIAQLTNAKTFPRPIVTRVDPLAAFYPAEDYHQDYATINPHAPYIMINDAPKVANLKKMFPALYRETPVLVTARR
jgi:peptide-methionine (S)-S-oxide reductase